MSKSVDMNLSKPQGTVEDRGAWCAVVHGATKSWSGLSNWVTITACVFFACFPSHQIFCLFIFKYIFIYVYFCIYFSPPDRSCTLKKLPKFEKQQCHLEACESPRPYPGTEFVVFIRSPGDVQAYLGSLRNTTWWGFSALLTSDVGQWWRVLAAQEVLVGWSSAGQAAAWAEGSPCHELLVNSKTGVRGEGKEESAWCLGTQTYLEAPGTTVVILTWFISKVSRLILTFEIPPIPKALPETQCHPRLLPALRVLGH